MSNQIWKHDEEAWSTWLAGYFPHSEGYTIESTGDNNAKRESLRFEVYTDNHYYEVMDPVLGPSRHLVSYNFFTLLIEPKCWLEVCETILETHWSGTRKDAPSRVDLVGAVRLRGRFYFYRGRFSGPGQKVKPLRLGRGYDLVHFNIYSKPDHTVEVAGTQQAVVDRISYRIKEQLNPATNRVSGMDCDFTPEGKLTETGLER
ncbi:hypothetical protein BO94DRAFT_546080 [Aspergillus sclerotioniger CBS 115572]|uniref:Uncharacterized protein n=1 Tax=Aspergillus sclerotioniger CBS 115572 TaxID=1450535 RepID=A0A317WPG6_9EURO|nr:hypothetical protein BO94DRAFT_546080 [Aspergillus sclerotioniger CBS 115572]PWY87915.1 hypothetical protein BO94DRAFT_546080 [Aspergillus sclerotioniger CBS 115572]